MQLYNPEEAGVFFYDNVNFFTVKGVKMAIKYKLLADKLREKIKLDIKNGIQKLPTEEELSKKYKVSRQTVRQALTLLEQTGLIEKRKGSGSYITGLLPEEDKNVITLILCSDQEYIYPNLIDDIKRTLFSVGYSLDVYATNNHLYEERHILESLIKKRPRGIIVEGSKSALPNMNVDLYRQLQFNGAKLVFLHNTYRNFEEVDYVKDDNRGGSYALVKHFYELGHRKIGGIFHNDDLQGLERFQGFMEAMRDLKLFVDDDQVAWFHTADYDAIRQNQNSKFLSNILPNLIRNCSAILVYNDEIAYWVIRELYKTNSNSYEELALASFDNTYLSNSNYLQLTTLSHKPHEMGERVATMMIDKLKGLPVYSQEVPWTLHQKESSRKKDD